MLLYQPDSGYCYNSDSVFLYDFISSFEPRGRMLDVGTGCGVVGLLVARDNPRVKLEGAEKQNAFVQYATKNAEVNGIDYVMHEGSFLEFEDKVHFDYIVSNPPFYHEGVDKSLDEMRHAARYNVHLPIDDFFQKVSSLLRPKGHFIFCYDPQQFALLCAALEAVNLRVVDVQFIHPKIDRPASLVMVHARKNMKSLMKTHPPFITFDGDDFSEQAKAVYAKARTHSIKCRL
ncbi:MAG: methyltransferase [Sulfurimonadaceae bacterium]|nr:methyltransferase [Sulfurimonadaceae bacterium]